MEKETDAIIDRIGKEYARNNIPFDENNLTIEQNQIIKQEISNLFGLI